MAHIAPPPKKILLGVMYQHGRLTLTDGVADILHADIPTAMGQAAQMNSCEH